MLAVLLGPRGPALFAALATLLAFGARVFGMYDLPPGLLQDEAFYGLDALAVLSGDIRPFYPANSGREGLWMLLIAPSIALLGRDPIALRLPAAAVSTLLVPATYALGAVVLRGWLGPAAARWVGVSGAWLVGGATWLIVFGRLGYRFNLFPLALAVLFILWWNARGSNRAWPWLLAGAALGVAQYTYTAARVLPLLFPLLAAADAVFERRWRDLVRPRRSWLLFVGSALLVAAPLLAYAATHPEDFLRRQESLSPLNEERSGMPPVQRVATIVVAGLSMFVQTGDALFYRNLPGKPLFDLWVAPLFVVGVVALVAAVRRPEARFALAGVATFYLAGAVPLGAVPHNVHWIGLAPLVLLFPGVGAAVLSRWAVRGRLQGPVAVGAAALVAASGAVGIWQYFAEWSRLPAVRLGFDADAVDIANAMNDRGLEADTAFVLTVSPLYPEGYTNATVRFMYKRPAPSVTVRGEEESAREALERLRAAKSTIVRYERLPSRDLPADNRDAVNWLLTQFGDRVNDQYFAGFRVAEYDVEAGASPLLTLTPLNAAAGPVAIRGVASGLTPSGLLWARVQVELREPLREDAKLSLRLLRPDGAVAGQDDRPLLATETFKGTRDWAAGERGTALFLIGGPRAAAGWRLAVVAYDGGSGRAYAAPVDVGPALR